MNNTNPLQNNNGFDMNSTIPANQNFGFDPNNNQAFNSSQPNFYPTQPVNQPVYQQPVARPEKQDPSFKEWLLSLIVCGAGIGGIALGIASMVVASNTYGAIGAAGDYASKADIQAGPPPVIALIMAIIALCLGAGAVVLGILFGNKAASQGKPRGAGLTIGTACGIAAVIVCIFAMFITSCSTCSYCSIKDFVDKNSTPSVPSYYSYYN